MSNHGSAEPSAWVLRWLADLPAPAQVLDFASGEGRHALAAVAMGHQAMAVDRDTAALTALELRAGSDRLRTRCADLEAGPWPFETGERFDAIIVTNYLFRPRYALLCALLAPGGILIHETFAAGNAVYGRPSNPDFLLREGESIQRAQAAGLIVVGYESGHVRAPRPAVIQRICAARPPRGRERFVLG